MNVEVKLIVVGLFAVSASIDPFLSLFLQDKGFGQIATGMLISISRMLALAATPVICSVADLYDCHRVLLALLAVLAATVMAALMYVPHGNFTLTALLLGVYATFSGSKMVITDTIVLKSLKDDCANRAATTRAHRSRLVADGSSAASETGLLNAASQPPWEASDADEDESGSLGPSNGSEEAGSSAEKYPLQRLWGSISYGTVAFASGLWVRFYAGDRPNPYLVIPALHGLILSAYGAILLISYLRHRRAYVPRPLGTSDNALGATKAVGSRQKSDGANADREAAAEVGRARTWSVYSTLSAGPTVNLSEEGAFWPSVRAYRRLMTDGRILGPVLGGVSLLSLSENVAVIFLFPYIRDTLEGTPELFSAALAVQILSEVIVFCFCRTLLMTLGKKWMLVIAALAFGFKMVAYSVMRRAWVLLSIEVVHGMCFAVMWAASVAHVTSCAEDWDKRLNHSSQRANRDAAPPPRRTVRRGSSKEPLTSDEPSGATAASAKSDEDGLAKVVMPEPLYGADVTGKDGGCSAQREGEEDGPASLVSKALGVLWLWVMGVPSVVSGLLPLLYSGTHMDDTQVTELLFRVMGVACGVVAAAFLVYGRLGWIV